MIRKLAPYTKGYRVYILLGILCSAGEAVLELMLPKAMSNIVDYGIGGNGGAGDRSYILTMGLKMVLMALICLALGVGAAALAAKAGMGFGANVRAADHPGLLPEESGAVAEICRCGNVAGGHRLTGGLTGPRSDTGACRGSFFRTRWRTWGSSRYRPCSGCSLCPRRAWRPGG